MQSTPGLSPGEAHGQRSLAGYSPRGRKESFMTERLHTHTLCKHLEIGAVVLVWLFLDPQEGPIHPSVHLSVLPFVH